MDDKLIRSKEDQQQIVHEEKSGIHKNAVHRSLDDTTQNQLIKQSSSSDSSRYINYQQQYPSGETINSSRPANYPKQGYPSQNDQGSQPGTIQGGSQPVYPETRYTSQHNQGSQPGIILGGSQPAGIKFTEQKTPIYEDRTGIHRNAVRSSIDESTNQIIKTGYKFPQGNQGSQPGIVQGGTQPVYPKTIKIYRKGNGPVNPGQQKNTSQSNVGSGGRYTVVNAKSRVTGPASKDTVIGGVAGAATLAPASKAVINKDKTGIGAGFVKSSLADITKQVMVKAPESVVFAEKVWDKKSGGKKGLIKTAGSVLVREIEAAVGNAGSGNGGVDDRARGLSQKYGYKAGKFALLGGFAATRGTHRLTRYTHKVAKDVASGALTGKEARLAILKRSGKSVSSIGGSIGKVIKEEAIKGIEDFQGSEDLGMQALTKPKNVIVQSKRYVKLAVSAKNAVKKGLQGTAKLSYKAAYKTIETIKFFAASIRKAFASPLIIKGAAIAAAIILCLALLLSIVSAITSIIPAITLKSEDTELAKTYKYITERDADLTIEIREIPRDFTYYDIDKFDFYLNGVSIEPYNLTVYTDADAFLLYLDSKHNDFKLNKVKNDINELHHKVAYYTTRRWIERIYTHDDDYYEVIHLDINVTTINFSSYVADHIDELLTKEQQERMKALEGVGLYTTRANLGSPFGDENYYITYRWGWYPKNTYKVEHNGIDIHKPAGTPVTNVLSGKVTSATSGYVVVKNGRNTVTYTYLTNVRVSAGQEIKKGDVIGSVGSSGGGDVASTGPHLHLEYSINGFNTNPGFYLTGTRNTGSGSSGIGSGDIVEVAESQLGNAGGEPYWSWYGFNSRVAWCACFVSWCADQCGYIRAGVIPKFSYCPTGVNWFQNQGLWQPGGGSYVPKQGDIIFFDWEGDGTSDHVGIVNNCDGSTVFTVEGNSGDQCRNRTYSLYSGVIIGYGTPAYPVVEPNSH